MSALNLALFTADGRADPYLAALARTPDVRLTAICDPMPRLAEQAAAGWGARVVAQSQELFAGDRPDALLVTVPSRLLGDVLEQAVAHRVPFFVEPPGALDWDAARRLVQPLSDAPLVTAVGMRLRWTDVVREAKAYLGDGPPPLGHGCWLTGGVDELADVSSLLWNEGCQWLDLWRYLLGEIEAVAAAQTGTSGLAVTLRSTSGGVGAFTVSALPAPMPRIEFETMGEGWSLRVGRSGFDPNAELSLHEPAKTTTLRQVNEPWTEMLEAFLEAVRTRNPAAVGPTFPESTTTLAVAEAVRRAVQHQRWVELAEVTGTRSATDAPPTPE